LGVIAKPKKTAILEAVRSAQELANAYKSTTLPGCPRKSIAQKESVLGDPFEGGRCADSKGNHGLPLPSKQRPELAL
jgi:hypothetical protein